MLTVIRPAAPHEAREIAAIKVANWAGTYRGLIPDAILVRYLDLEDQVDYVSGKLASPANLLLVAEGEAGGVAGFALTFTDTDPEPWLESLHVLRALRGTGVGTMLMRATAVELIARGYSAVRLGVVGGNEAAARFYDRLGGSVLRRQRADWAGGVPELIYRWGDLRTLAT